MARKKKELNRADELLDELMAEYPYPEDILGEQGLLRQLGQCLIEQALVGELHHHLNAEAESLEEPPSEGDSPHNSRNGYSKKTVQSEQGALELSIPRDRQETFEPVLVPKHQRRLSGLDEKILAMYAPGLSTRDISSILEREG